MWLFCLLYLYLGTLSKHNCWKYVVQMISGNTCLWRSSKVCENNINKMQCMWKLPGEVHDIVVFWCINMMFSLICLQDNIFMYIPMISGKACLWCHQNVYGNIHFKALSKVFDITIFLNANNCELLIYYLSIKIFQRRILQIYFSEINAKLTLQCCLTWQS